MYFVAHFIALACFNLSCTVASTLPRQSATEIAKIPGWIECIAMRSNGAILATRLDAPEVWTVDPATKATKKLVSIPDTLGLTGIIEAKPDMFMVFAGNFSTSDFDTGNGSWAIWRVDLTGARPELSLMQRSPTAGSLLGATKINDYNVLAADAANGAVYIVSASTGQHSIFLQDKSMKPPANARILEGVHGVRYIPGLETLFYTNTFGNSFHRTYIENTTYGVSNEFTTITTDIQTPVDLAVLPDGTAYIMSMGGKGVYEVMSDGKSKKVVSADSGTTVAFGRGPDDKNTLYFATSSGAIMAVPDVIS